MEFFSRDEDKPQTDPVGTEDEPPGSINERGTSSTSKEERFTQQVAIAQSSIKRLQMVVKEKEDIIVTLQNAVSDAYQAALQEQAYDQAQLEALHEVFFANAGGQNRSTSANLDSTRKLKDERLDELPKPGGSRVFLNVGICKNWWDVSN